ncbi:pimeloyl-ACP methyl ester carboxylesterase [Ciceribacter lividus]|uniref:Pimeloyl-ACP methyl ester carboxylesterase n=1 Tax=Ciceribacter lividus TaxID=1197950 RepID=A0A6I7HQM5_9HYPH|nr:alpha/beta hydrolase [Ciceribacter lividus]RCW27587.1 pimeloyl-ACP methyl ester carboxylesterase [Ciceribacter lividus]
MAADGTEDFAAFEVTVPDGLTLRGRIFGEEIGGTPVVCLAGLTRNGRDFAPLAQWLADHPERPFKVVTIDSRGRGASDRDPDASRYTVPVETGDVIAVCETLGIARAAFIGTSRGGLILHILAALRPDLIAAAVLNDIGPVIEAEGLRHIQAYLGRNTQLSNFTQAADHLQAVHGPHFPALSGDDWQEMARAIYREQNGMIEADCDPAIAEATVAADFSAPLPDLWPQFEGFADLPLMAIRGEHSTLLSEETVEEMGRRHPALRRSTASGQGHAPLLHLGDLSRSIHRFLAESVG